MRRVRFSVCSKTAVIGAVALHLGLLATQSPADPPPATEPANPSATSLLAQLSDETVQLYRQSRHSIVRVQLPTPQWLQQQDFLRKWGSVMDPAVREKLMEQQDRALGNPAQQPTTISATTEPSIHLLEPPRPVPTLIVFAVGLLVDDRGHAVFPVFVDRKYIGNSILPAVTGDGQPTTATFVGSDARTNLTVLQLADHSGTPAPLGHRRPEDGSLTLTIGRDGDAKLVVWTNQRPDPGFAILTDGSVAGFGFDGHFLGAATAKPIVDQLIATGEVNRARLGVLTQEVGRDDPIRRQHPELGTSPAIRILQVEEGSAAAAGGVLKDDLVLSIGDETVGDAPTFAAVIAIRRGDTILRVLRGSRVVDLTVNLRPQP
jgi:S1-C subfamily serine protease